MTTVLNFVRTFPTLSASVVAVIVVLPIVIEIIEFIQRIQTALGQ